MDRGASWDTIRSSSGAVRKETLSSQYDSSVVFEEKTDDARACAQSGHCPFKCLNNLFTLSLNIVLNREHHDYNTRSKDNVRKSFSNRNWGLWTSTHFVSNKWNNLDKSLRELKSLDKFKMAICNVTFD